MSRQIYRVRGLYASGRLVSHLVGEVDAVRAIMSVQAVDDRIVTIISCDPVML